MVRPGRYGPGVEIQVAPAPSPEVRCGYCTAALSGADEARTCGACGARFHAACQDELGRAGCPTLGCREARPVTALAPPAKEPPRASWPRRLLRTLVLALVLGWLLVRGVDRTRVALLGPEARAAAAHAHCERARAIEREACQRLSTSPIYLPASVMQEMADELTRALQVDPGHLEALHDRAYWRMFSGDKRARADYDWLLELDPGNGLAWYQRGRLRCGGGDHAGAAADYSRSLELAPRRGGNAAWGARGRCRRDTGDLAGALADFQVDGDPFEVGSCLQDLGRHAEAVAAFDARLSHGDHPLARWRRGVSRLALGDRAGAVADLGQALETGHDELRQEALARIAAGPGDPLASALEEALRAHPEER